MPLGEPAEPEWAFGLIQQTLAAKPNSRSTLIVGTQCLVTLGRMDDARHMARRLRAIWPDTSSVLRQRFCHQAHVKDAILALLRQAGLPE